MDDSPAYARCDVATAIASYLIRGDATAPFVILDQARIAYLLQQEPLFLRGERAHAYIAQAIVQGPHRLLWPFVLGRFADSDVDFVVYLDQESWTAFGQDRERGASTFPIRQEALIFHELSHLRQTFTKNGTPRFGDDGRPTLALARHTYEFFDTEVRRYGPETLALTKAGQDLDAGALAERARRRPQLRLARGR